ncbi:keratinocyte differentiation factor 1, partial [Ornithorhynchus anatinus]
GPPPGPRRARPGDCPAGGEAETITFISGSAEAAGADPPACCFSRPWLWRFCKTVFCFRRCRGCYRRCGGCLRSCGACLPLAGAPEGGPGQGAWDKEPNGGPPPRSPARASPRQRDGERPKKSAVGSSFSYPDVKLKGIPVYPERGSPRAEPEPPARRSLPCSPAGGGWGAGGPGGDSHRSSEEYYSFHESDLDLHELGGGSMSSREIDVLIFKKLTELFSVHQIDELAKCTSDTVFLEKTNKISDLISSITQDYRLDEQDAECRLVRGIIRISTRKSRARPPAHDPRGGRGAAPDSGHETMVGSVVSQDDLTVQISEETTADAIARNMRPFSAPGFQMSHTSSFQGTETDSSGTPLLQGYC